MWFSKPLETSVSTKRGPSKRTVVNSPHKAVPCGHIKMMSHCSWNCSRLEQSLRQARVSLLTRVHCQKKKRNVQINIKTGVDYSIFKHPAIMQASMCVHSDSWKMQFLLSKLALCTVRECGRLIMLTVWRTPGCGPVLSNADLWYSKSISAIAAKTGDSS